MQNIVQKLLADERHQKGLEYGEPRSGHPEGKLKFHIADLEANLELLCKRGVSDEEYWKLKFLIQIHDLCKAEAQSGVPTLHPLNHATLAKELAREFTDDPDMLNMIQYHDENYQLWKEYLQTKSYSRERLQTLLGTIKDWDLFLMFIIIDGCTKGKDYEKLGWFINEVRKYKSTKIDATWILTP
jgi:hypothetical protein